MLKKYRDRSDLDTADYLSRSGIQPTPQRVAVARVLFSRMTHMSADDVYCDVNASDRTVSRATVYNTLGLFVEKGVVREVIIDPAKIFYDPNIAPHHHFYDVDTGKLTDIDAVDVGVTGLPPLPEGKALEGVEIIVRLRQSK